MLPKKSSVKKLIIFILLFPLVLTFCGCKEQISEEDSPNVDLITFEDSLERVVLVPVGTKEAAVLDGCLADIWNLSGGKITAMTKDASKDFYLDFPDAVNLGTLGDRDIEALLSLNPSFVIANSSLSSNISLLSKLEKLNITVAFFNISSFNEYLDTLNICTDITGRKDLYEKNGVFTESKINSAKEVFFSESVAEENNKYLLLGASPDTITAKKSSSYIVGDMLSELGYKNIVDTDFSLLTELDTKLIAREDPYRIFIVQIGDDTEKSKEQVNAMFSENPEWRALTAFKEGRVHFLDKRLFSLKPNARWGESYEILIDILNK